MDQNLIEQTPILLSSHEVVRKICSPIFELFSLSFFRFLRVYKDNSRINLCTHPQWTSFFYSQNLYNVSWFDSLYNNIKNFEVIWDIKAACQDNIVGIHARENFNIHHGFSLIRNYHSYYEIYDFATDDPHQILNDIYLQHIEIFEKFLFYFKDQAADLIKDFAKNKIILKDNIIKANTTRATASKLLAP